MHHLSSKPASLSNKKRKRAFDSKKSLKFLKKQKYNKTPNQINSNKLKRRKLLTRKATCKQKKNNLSNRVQPETRLENVTKSRITSNRRRSYKTKASVNSSCTKKVFIASSFLYLVSFWYDLNS